MKKILVATDGSDHAGRAVDLAADLASKYDADLIILHVSGHTPLTESERHLVDVELADEVLKYVAEDPHDIFEGYAQSGISDFFLGHEKRDMAVRAAIGQPFSATFLPFLLDNLGNYAGADSSAAFADGETDFLLHGDGGE